MRGLAALRFARRAIHDAREALPLPPEVVAGAERLDSALAGAQATLHGVAHVRDELKSGRAQKRLLGVLARALTEPPQRR